MEMPTCDVPLFPAALKLEPGAAYVIELQQALKLDAITSIREQLAVFGDSLGVKFLVLESGMKIARVSASQAG